MRSSRRRCTRVGASGSRLAARAGLPEHDVEPGTFTADQAANAEALARLREFARRYPKVKIYLGHTQ